MKTIIINNTARTIEINKTFTKAASKFGSPEYQQLQEARRDYPNYRVITVTQKTAKPEFKGLTYDYMEDYIKQHDDAGHTIMAEFLMLRGMSDAGKDADADAVDYGTIKDWFFQQFPAIEQFHKDRKVLLDRIAQKKAEKLTFLNAQFRE